MQRLEPVLRTKHGTRVDRRYKGTNYQNRQ
jgi:hypothetical protein